MTKPTPSKRNTSRGAVFTPVVIILLLVAAAIVYFATSTRGKMLIVSWFTTESTLREFEEPKATEWRPEGVRRYSSNPHPAARQVTFGRTLHTDLHSSDEIATAVAPMFELDWTVEPAMFIPEGPVFDSLGNVYFSPIFPPEDVLLIALDGETGARKWVLSGKDLGGAGIPLILQDPETGKDLVYTFTYGRAVATDTDGNIIWDVSLIAEAVPDTDNRRHCFGASYHIQSDSVIGVMGNGTVQILDRKTGKSRLAKPFVMPGAPTGVTNFDLPEDISDKANLDIAHMYPPHMADDNPVASVLHAAAGELQQITNFFSVDSNSGRVWVASTLEDEADGNIDGFSDSAGLYGLELIVEGDLLSVEIAVVAEVPGGTASTPTVSADGQRLYVADAYDSVYAIDTNTGEYIWTFNVGDKVTGSIDVSADNGEIYANTRTGIKQLLDKGDHAELGWTANLDMYHTGRFQKNIKSLGAEITANGVAFTGAAGIVAGKQKFPLKLGAGLIDRKTGEIRYFVGGGEDSVSSMVTGPDGGLYVGNSPLRRVLGRATFGKHVSPQAVVGGVTRYKPVRFDLFLRDILKAAADRAANAASNASVVAELGDKQIEGAVNEDLYQIKQLLVQSAGVGPKGVEEGSIEPERWLRIKALTDDALGNLQPSTLAQVVSTLRQSLQILGE